MISVWICFATGRWYVTAVLAPHKPIGLQRLSVTYGITIVLPSSQPCCSIVCLFCHIPSCIFATQRLRASTMQLWDKQPNFHPAASHDSQKVFQNSSSVQKKYFFPDLRVYAHTEARNNPTHYSLPWHLVSRLTAPSCFSFELSQRSAKHISGLQKFISQLEISKGPGHLALNSIGSLWTKEVVEGFCRKQFAPSCCRIWTSFPGYPLTILYLLEVILTCVVRVQDEILAVPGVSIIVHSQECVGQDPSANHDGGTLQRMHLQDLFYVQRTGSAGARTGKSVFVPWHSGT